MITPEIALELEHTLNSVEEAERFLKAFIQDAELSTAWPRQLVAAHILLQSARDNLVQYQEEITPEIKGEEK